MSRFDQLARAILAAGAPTLPTFLLVRPLELFEVEFAGLEFAEDATVPMIDSAILALIRALGTATPRDVDTYLGLGDHVSKEMLLRLIDEKLVVRVDLDPELIPASERTLNSALPPPDDRKWHIDQPASEDEPATSVDSQAAPASDASPFRRVWTKTENRLFAFVRRIFGRAESPASRIHPRRVHELAQELGVSNRDLIRAIRDLGLDVNNHMSWLEADTLERIKEELEPRPLRKKDVGTEQAKAAAVDDSAISDTHAPTDSSDVSRQVVATAASGSGDNKTPNALYVSRADELPRCKLTLLGTRALDLGEVSKSRRRSLRVVFAADPLVFVAIADEKRARHSIHLRGKLLPLEDIPPVFRRLDEFLSQTPELRAAECGLGKSLPGVRGTLVGVVPGEQWEVRAIRDRSESPPLLVVAGFPSTDESRFVFRAFVRFNDAIEERANLQVRQALRLRGQDDIAYISGLDMSKAPLRADGAFLVESDVTDLDPLIGNADEAQDVYVESDRLQGWSFATRVHGVPADINAAQETFYEYVTRRDGSLRQNFDRTCEEVRAMLLAYWERDYVLPTPDEVARVLWDRKQLRAALCMRRLRTDLILPYA